MLSTGKIDGRSTWAEVKLLVSLSYTALMPFLLIVHHNYVNFLAPITYYNALIDYFACESFGVSPERNCTEFVTPLHQTISYNVSLTLLAFGIFIPIDKFLLTSDFRALQVKFKKVFPAKLKKVQYRTSTIIKNKFYSNTNE